MHASQRFLASTFLVVAAAAFSQSSGDPQSGMQRLLGNEHVRVWQLTKLPHKPSPSHYTPPCVLIFLNHTRMRWTFPDKRSVEEEFAPGSIKWWPGGTHVSENVGDVPIDMLIVVPLSALPKETLKK